MSSEKNLGGAYTFVRFDWSHSDAIRSLYKRVNGRVWSETDFSAKFDTQSIGGDPIGYAAFSPTGEAVAYYGIFPIKVVKGKNVFLAAQSGNTMTDPDHQGKGLFTQLAKLTYEAAKKEGISFVFGFPNKNSYPGFVKKLNWRHDLTMRGYNLFVPTFPLGELVNKFPGLKNLYKKYQEIILNLFCNKFEDVQLNTCLSVDGFGCCLRDKAYSDYKKNGLFVLKKYGVDIYFKVGRFVEIGDVYFENNDDLKKALRFLKVLAMLLGVIRVRFFVTPGCFTSRAFDALMPSREGLAYG